MLKSKKITVGVIFGGQSGEHEVSLVSAQSVIDGLDKKKYKIIPIGITKSGQWLIGRDALIYLKTGRGSNIIHESILPESKKLTSRHKSTNKLIFTNHHQGQTQSKIDIIFPVLHGPYGEDGIIQGLLELAHLPYVGAGVLGSACGMDKAIMKALFNSANIPGPRYLSFIRDEWHNSKVKLVNNIKEHIKFPNFVKPANLGSSIGISKCRNINELIRGITVAFKYDRKVVIEEAIDGREIECSVLGNNDPIASVPGEVIPNRDFYDYEAKYIDGQAELLLPAPLTKQQSKTVQNLALKAFRAIDCSGLARVDFFIERATNQILVNEINTLPGFTSISMYPKLWSASGIPYKKLLDILIRLAFERNTERNKILMSYQPAKNWYK